MAYGTKYTITFKDYTTGNDGLINLKKNAYVGSSTALKGADKPLVIEMQNNDEDLLEQPIKARSFKIKFVTGSGLTDIETFKANTDSEWQVEIKYDGVTEFYGWVLTDQSSEEWHNSYRYLTLTATDGLGLLKNIPLTNYSGTTFYSCSSMMQFLRVIAWSCLQKAWPDLDLYVFDNLFEITQDDKTVLNTNCAWADTMLDVRTFAKDSNEFEDCFTVLTKILYSRNCILFQKRGAWWIVRVAELINSDTISGVIYNPTTPATITAVAAMDFNVTVSKTDTIIPVENFMVRSYQQPLKKVKVIYNYDSFAENVINETLQKGAQIMIVSPPNKEFLIDCWDYKQGALSAGTANTYSANRREIINGTTGEKEQNYIYLTRNPSTNSYLMSQLMPCVSQDKISLSFARRTKNAYTGNGTEELMYVQLQGVSNNYFLDDDGRWYLSNAGLSVNVKVLQKTFASGDDRSTWIEYSIESDYIPESGYLIFRFIEGSASAFTGQETHFKDFRLTYLPYVNGFKTINVKGDYDQLERSDDVKTNKDFNVDISDSPKHNLKGALYLSDGATLTTKWYTSSLSPSTGVPLKYHFAKTRYYLSKRHLLKVEGTFLGLLNGTDLICPVDRYTIPNGDLVKRFLPLSQTNVDMKNATWSGNLLEVNDVSESSPDTVSATHSFDYIIK